MAFDSIQTPAGKVEGVLGGAANYFSVAASFYYPVHIVAVVGSDFPKEHLNWLETRGVNTEGVEVSSGKTFHWSGRYDKNLNEAHTLATELNVFEHFQPKLNAAQKKAKYVFLANIHPKLQLDVLDQVEDAELVACDTMNFWIQGERKALLDTLRRVDILSINDGEAYLLSGKKSIVEAAEEIQKMGPSVVIIKRGEYGAALFTPGGGMFVAPAYLLRHVTDPTGAGDTFAGAFMGYLASEGLTRIWLNDKVLVSTKILKQAVLAGCVMASFTVEDFSFNRLKNLNIEDLMTRKQQLLRMVSTEG